MPRIVWDAETQKTFETGVSNGVHYMQDKDGKYVHGVAWNGLTGVTQSPSGADANALWADNIKYLNLRAAEEFGATVEAYTYPKQFGECDGSVEIVPGVTIGQQNRKKFGLSYKTIFGNDTEGEDYGYKIHMIYNCDAAPSEKAYSTKNDSPDAINFSWELSTTPVNVTGYKPTAHMEITSTDLNSEFLAKIEDILYGTDTEDPRMPLPDEIFELYKEYASDSEKDPDEEIAG